MTYIDLFKLLKNPEANWDTLDKINQTELNLLINRELRFEKFKHRPIKLALVQRSKVILYFYRITMIIKLLKEL